MLEREDLGIIIKGTEAVFFMNKREGYYVGSGSFYGTASPAYSA